MLLSVGAYYAFALFKGRSENAVPNATLSLIFICVALSTTLLSVFIKRTLVARAIEQQQVGLVQQAYIVAWAMCEVGALLGMLDFFVNGHRHFYILFIIAAFGLLLHYPRREHVINASPKSPII
jgi:hypothetical protein